MDANILFSKALGLGSGWKVVKSEMDVAGRELKLWLDFEPGSQFACPQCGEFCPVHDTVEKKWRHLDFWQHRTELNARVPRTNCQEHGVLLAAVPWARAGSGFTLMMEAMILLLGQQMSVSATARHLGESDKRLWRVLEHYVMGAHGAKDWSQVRRIMIDETSARKGHRYVTVVLDAQSHDLLLMVEGRSAEAVAEFLTAMPAHGAKAEAITEVVMDMSPAYIAGVQAHFPNARIVFDLFHIMKLAGEALDAVRKNLRKAGCRSDRRALGHPGQRMDALSRANRPASHAGPRLSQARTRHRLARDAPRGPRRWRSALHPLVVGLGRPLSARTLPQTFPNP